jgi:hypothetical protein
MNCRLIFFVLPGCFQPYQDLPALDFSEINFEQPGLETSSAVVRAFDLAEHTCPDGEPARIYAVYAEGAAPGAPVALMLHSGAFDYIVSSEEGQPPLDGRHYRTESRLERPWALAKVWETLGMLPTPVEAGEDNRGSLAVAMVNAGWVQLYPANCWGDLWHHDMQVNPNDSATEGFERDGLGMAVTAARVVTEPGFAGSVGIEIPLEIDPSQFFLVGLGDGGRGVAELLARPELEGTVAGVVLDSTPDLASAYVDDPGSWFDELIGMELLYGEAFTEDPDATSVYRHIQEGRITFPVGFVWSPLDHNVPPASTTPLAELIIAAGSPHIVIENQGGGHVFTNSDDVLAKAMVGWLSTGEFDTGEE